MQKSVITRKIVKLRQHKVFLISNVLPILNVAFFLLGDSTAYEFYVPTFRNTVPSSWAVQAYTAYEDGADIVPKRRHIKFRRQGITPKILLDISPQMAETFTRNARQVSSHSEYLQNRSRGLDVTRQTVRGDLTVQP